MAVRGIETTTAVDFPLLYDHGGLWYQGLEKRVAGAVVTAR